MEVTIHSTLLTVGGHATIRTDPSNTVQSLISEFCNEKNIRVCKEYVISNREQEILNTRMTLEECGVKNGETLFISSREVSERGFCCRGCNQWWTLAAVLLLIGIVGIVIVSILRVKSTKQPRDYGVVLDAGSSHTQIFVYKWPADKENGTGVVEQIYTERAPGGGISNYTDDPRKAGRSLEPILDSAVKHVPEQQRDVTPVFLGATAGMRLLEASDNSTAQQILSSVRSTFEKYVFWFNNSIQQVRILGGDEEGTFSWVTTNFLTRAFDQDSVIWNGMLGHIPTYTYGALDLGGASTQITFIPVDKVEPEYAETVRMYGTEYTVYSHSYLCYGLNEAIRQLAALLVLDALSIDPSVRTVQNPCQPEGNSSTYHYSEIFEAPCTNHTTPNGTAKNTTFTFEGTSDSEQCGSITSRLFNFTDCDDPPCSFNNVHQPDVFGQFYAFSGYWNILSFLNVTKSTLEEFEAAIDSYCAKNWSQVSGMPSAPAYLIRYCFDAHFIHTLLIDGYKFSNESWSSIQFKKKVNGADLGWSLGFMLNATNRFPERYPDAILDVTMTVLLILLFIILIGIAFGFAWHARQRQKTALRSYDRLSSSYGAI